MPSHFSIRPVSNAPSASYHLIFFITGNPGLIAYYDTFLGTLSQLLSENPSSETYHIYGQNLAGYEDDDTPLPSTGLPHSLEDQIESRIQLLQEQMIPSGSRKGQPYDTIILMGHSVGTYIILEILQRLRKSSSSLNVKAGILLMPTVIGLAESPSGVKLSPLFLMPGFVRGFSLLARGLLWPLPRGALQWLVQKLLGFPDSGAAVTARFLKSNMGVWQALHLAKEEMENITIDKWDADVWGIEQKDPEVESKIPKLFFYFAEEDHWVGNHTRDALISARGKSDLDLGSAKPEMVIDTNGIGHAFCIHHSETAAEKVKLWVEDIVALSK